MAVSNCDDDGSPGTLRTAIEGAADGDTIDMSALACTLIVVRNKPLTSTVPHLALKGPGAEALTISGNDAVRVLEGRNLEIADVTFANGAVSSGFGGACIETESDLSLDGVSVANCSNTNPAGSAGGAIAVFGNLTMHHASITSSTVSGLYADGGGAMVGGTATLYDSTISGNQAQSALAPTYGGGIFAFGTVTLHASTIEGNTATSAAYAASGGGIHSSNGDVSILDGSTVSNNSIRSDQSYAFGGGISVGTTLTPTGIMTARKSTITGNSASSGCAACLVSGGGVHAFDSIDAAYSTFSYNEATCDDLTSQCSAGGGGMTAFGQSATSAISALNTTISGNNAIGGAASFGAGGGIMGGYGLHIIARNSTIAFNDASTLGGGIAASCRQALGARFDDRCKQPQRRRRGRHSRGAVRQQARLRRIARHGHRSRPRRGAAWRHVDR